jgi:hypothetical protein
MGLPSSLGDTMKSHFSFVPGLLLFISATAPALADDKPKAADKSSNPGKHHDGTPGRDGMKGHDEMKGRDRAPGQMPERDGGAVPRGQLDDADGGPPHRGYKNGLRELFQDLKDGKLKKEDLDAKLAQLKNTRDERRKEHREDLSKRWGPALSKAPARDELKLHARRMALLNRALVLAQQDTKPDKDKTVDRVTKLLEKENARHERAMTQIQSRPGAAAAASATAPTSSATTVGSGGGQ